MGLYTKSNHGGGRLPLFITFPIPSLLRQYQYDSYQTNVLRKHGAEVSKVKMRRFLKDNSKPMEATLFEELKTLPSLLMWSAGYFQF